MSLDQANDLHFNGIHTECRPLAAGKHRGDGTARRCKYAGSVERFHGHDFEGTCPVDGCTEWGN